ncbi:neurogenic locus notch-like protein 1 [Plakobranchus ocellatus]|uniref:Neurogenic locus notch-like protein 1 n=1 Tax=Plakobranchus ocellatus TaxID=259542 RepID=A0AAV3ZRB0_9GAST|nr:neurogenic locus notch-like protein 1 [Plakobranchus ocellatus]
MLQLARGKAVPEVMHCAELDGAEEDERSPCAYFKRRDRRSRGRRDGDTGCEGVVVHKGLVEESYSGNRCENFTDICDSQPCINNGTCENVKGDYVCHCDDTFKGRNCSEDVDECLVSNPCHNGSTCHNLNGSFMCECPVGLRGRTCSEDIDECLERSPCALGATCVNTPGSFSCQCLHGYTGELCDEDVNECSLSEDLCTYVGNFPPFTPNATLFLERANMPTLYTNTTEIKNSTEGSLFINGSSSDLPTSPSWPDAPVSHMLCVNTQPEMTVPFYLTGQLSLQTQSKEITKVHPVLRVGGETVSDNELTSVFRTLSTKETILVNWTLCTGDAKIIPSIIPDHDKVKTWIG